MASETLVEALKKAGVLSEIDFAGATWQYVMLRHADALLPILAAHAGPAAKREALRVLLRERLREMTVEEFACLAEALSDEDVWTMRGGYIPAWNILAPEPPAPVEVSE